MPPSVLFYPQPPRAESALGQLCARRGYAVVTDPADAFDVAIFWTICTVRRPPPALLAIARKTQVLNLGCRDIGKRHVDRVFHAVFGYRSLISPRTETGHCVRKSNLNATHDGVIVRCPVRRVSRRCVYQRLIDNRAGRWVEDLRTPVIGGRIPFVLVSRKPLEDRFDGPVTVQRVDADRVYSLAERARIARFCKWMGLDYAELDVLRDRGDQRLYIVDANPTPWTPEGMSARTRESALDGQAPPLEALFARCAVKAHA